MLEPEITLYLIKEYRENTMNILITGSTGLIGTALNNSLTKAGHTVYKLDRGRDPSSPFYWQPDKNIISFDNSVHINAVINLAGANISDSRWTAAKKKIILESRIQSTKLLSEYIAQLKSPPELFISGSAIGFYGDTGDKTANEASPAGTDFLAHVAQEWEKATKAAAAAGIRTVNLRTGIVLSPDGGALKKMLLPFKLALGGVIGSGQQYMSWVGIEDVTHIIEFIINNESITGPVNMVSPNPATNYEFTKTLGKALSRPTLFPMPAFVAKILFGEMGDALLLTSIRVTPDKLTNAGYKFINHNLLETFNSMLNK